MLMDILHMMEEKTILVTGGTGFIGGELTETLCKHNDVTTVDDASTQNIQKHPDGATTVGADATNSTRMEQLLDECQPDIVFHLAATSDVNATDTDVFEDNVSLTRTLVAACEQTTHPDIVLASSSAVYGNQQEARFDAPVRPTSAYGASKAACESLLSVYEQQTPADIICLRLANVVGPRLRNAVIPDFVSKLTQNGGRLSIRGDGRQEKSYIHVSDCVKAMIVLAEHRTQFDIANVTATGTTTVDEIATVVADQLGVSPERQYSGGRTGWDGDTHTIQMERLRLDDIGWSATLDSTHAVRRATAQLRAELR